MSDFPISDPNASEAMPASSNIKAVPTPEAAPTLDASMRRLPVYLVLDCSGSMTGEPIEAVR